jgi:hypothetical protein
MSARFRLPIFVAIILAITTAAFSREIRADFDHHVNFSQYKTYSWAKVDTPDPLWNDQVKEAVDRELTAKGWSQVPSSGDVSIVAVGTTREPCAPFTTDSTAGSGPALLMPRHTSKTIRKARS